MSHALSGLQVDVAAARLRDSVVSTAESDMTSQAYWLSATLALGAFLKVWPPLLHPLPLLKDEVLSSDVQLCLFMMSFAVTPLDCLPPCCHA